MTYGITPKTFDGHDIQSDTYESFFVEDSQTLDIASSNPVENTRPGLTPLAGFMQPEGKDYVLTVVMLGALTQDNHDQLRGWFDSIAGASHVLVVTDGNSVDREIACTIKELHVSGEGNNVFKVNLRAASATQTAVTPSTASPSINSTSFTATVANAGNTAAGLTITLTPTDAIDSADGYSKGRRIFLANQSEQALTHFAAEGYAIEITDGGIDTTSGFLSDLSDLRVWLNSKELDRWLNVTSPDASTKVWCNIAMRPGRFATLFATISDDSTVIKASSIDGFAGWARKGWLFIGSEPVVYELLDDFTASITRLAEFAASHSSGAAITWIEHVLTLTYGYDNADSPPESTDAKPVIDLDASSNTEHHWPGPFFNDNDRRSMTFRPTVEGDQSPHIRGYDDGDDLIFEDLLPVTGKPLADSVEVRFPVPLVGPLLIDYAVDNGMLLHGFAADLQGNESQLIEVIGGTGTAASYSLDNEATRLRMKAQIAAVAGEMGANTSSMTFAYPAGYVGPIHIVPDSDPSFFLYARALLAIHFTLDADTSVTGFAAKFDTPDAVIDFQILTEDRTEQVTSGAFIVAAAGEWSTAGLDMYMPAGNYWMAFRQVPVANGSILVLARSKAHLYINYLILPGDNVYLDPGLTELHTDSAGNPVYASAFTFPGESGFGSFDTTPAINTPLFAVLSAKQDPQADAPLQSGNTISIDNVVAPLDSTRAPQIVMSAAFDLFPLIGTITGESGDQAALTFMCKADESIEIDLGEGIVTDNETGLAANYAVDFSNPTKRIQLLKGSNDLVFAFAGASADVPITAAIEHSGTWL